MMRTDGAAQCLILHERLSVPKFLARRSIEIIFADELILGSIIYINLEVTFANCRRSDVNVRFLMQCDLDIECESLLLPELSYASIPQALHYKERLKVSQTDPPEP